MVKSGRYLTELVRGIDIDACPEIAGLQLAQALPKLPQRIDHIPITGIKHDHRPADGQRHHQKLEQVQDGCQPRQVLLDHPHQLVTGANKLVGRRLQNRGRRGWRLCE